MVVRTVCHPISHSKTSVLWALIRTSWCPYYSTNNYSTESEVSHVCAQSQNKAKPKNLALCLPSWKQCYAGKATPMTYFMSPFCYIRMVDKNLYRESYTSGHFIWNLWNEPTANFINFIWNDHKCKILFIVWPFKWDLIAYKINIIWARKPIVDTDVVNDAMSKCQRVNTRVVIWFLWHNVIHWKTATSYDKLCYQNIMSSTLYLWPLTRQFLKNGKNYLRTSICSYARPAQPCPIRWLGPLKSAETRSRI